MGMAAQSAPASISVAGNFEGNIVVGDNNFVVNTNHGTIVYQQAAPRVQLRGAMPQPPRRPRTFVGRARELALLENQIASAEPVVLSGAEGLGKTSLAKQVANGPAARSQPHGVIYLEGLDEQGTTLAFGDLLQRLFDTAYESQPPLKVDLASARTYLSNLRPMVLLSGMQLSQANLQSLADLFPSAPILIDQEWAPGGEVFTGLDLGPLERADSLLLLAERSGLAIDPTTQGLLDELAASLTDSPAALVTLSHAIREKRLGLADALDRLGKFGPEAAGGAPTALERAYLVVLSALSEAELSMLAQTGTAPGISVDRKWLEKVCGGRPVSEKLVALQLLQPNSPRLRLMSGLREFVLRGRDELADRNRLLDHLLEELENKQRDFVFVGAELGNLIGLLRWAAAEGRWKEALALARGLDPYLALEGLWDAWGTALESARQAAAALSDQAAQAWALHQLGTREIGLRDLDSARGLLEQARDLRLSLGDEVGAAYSQHNLDYLSVKASQPDSRKTPARRWLIGGLGALALLALLFAAALGLNAPPILGPTATLTATLPASSTPTAIPTATATASLTASRTSTEGPTATSTSSPTITNTSTATFIPLINAVMRERAPCFDGPGRIYLYYFGLLQGVRVQAIGRTDDGSWVLVQIPGFKDPAKSGRCWFATNSVDLEGTVMTLEPVYPAKVGPPISHNPLGYPAPKNVQATRSGNLVTVTWTGYLIPLGDREGENSPLYLVETWTCSNGKIVFSPHGLSRERFTISDDPGCSEPSHGRVFLSEKHGYIGPEEIPWPQTTPHTTTPTP